MTRIVLLLLPALLFLSACEGDPTVPIPGDPIGQVVNGIYVLSEGNFGDPEGARLSLYDLDRDTVYGDVFERSNNGMHLGSLGDDIKISDGKLYVLMSGSENLSIVSTSDHGLLQSATYSGAVPHDLLIDPARGRIYMTMLFSGSILGVDLFTLQPVDTFLVGSNPQGVLLLNDRLFVCNTGFGSDKTVSIINLPGDSVESTLTLSDGPTGIVQGPDGRVWVSCTGNSFGAPPTTGAVYMLNPFSLAIEDSIMFLENLWGAIAVGNDGSVYLLGATTGSFYGGPVHRLAPGTYAVTLNYIDGTFYGMAVDPSTGNLHVTDVRNLAGEGEVQVFDMSATLVASFPASRGPAAFAFKH